MAVSKKISELPVLTTADTADLLAVVDVTDNVTKRTTVGSSAVYNQGGTNSVDRTTRSRLQERVSVEDKGAVLDGVFDNTTAVNNAIADLDAVGGGTLYYGDGILAISGALNLRDNVKHIGNGPGRTIIKPTAAFTEIFSGDGVPNTSQSNTLASNANAGVETITLTAGKGANFTEKTYAILISDDAGPGGTTLKQGEFIFIQSIATDVITLGGPLQFAYTTANTAELQNVNFLDGQHIEGFEFDGNNFLSNRPIDLEWAMRPIIKNCYAKELPGSYISFGGCYYARLDNISGLDFLSDGVFGETNKFGYAIIEQGMNEGLVATNLNFDAVRHGYTTAAGSQTHGVPVNSRIVNGVVSNGRGSGWDTHADGVGIEFHNCTTNGSLHAAFQIRSLRSRIVGAYGNDCLGPGILLSSDAKDCDVSDFHFFNTNLGTSPVDNIDWREQGCIYDNGERNIVHDGRVDSCGGPGMELAGGNDQGIYRNIRIRNPVRLASVEFSGFLADSAGPVKATLDNIDIEDFNGNMVDGFEFTTGTFTDGIVRNCRSRGHSGGQYKLSGTDILQIVNPQGGSNRSYGLPFTVTIATGVLDVELSGVLSSRLKVNGEGAAADTLDTINGGEDGWVVILFKGDADITVSDQTGNIFLAGGVNFGLNSAFDNMELMRIAGNWVEQRRMTT